MITFVDKNGRRVTLQVKEPDDYSNSVVIGEEITLELLRRVTATEYLELPARD